MEKSHRDRELLTRSDLDKIGMIVGKDEWKSDGKIIASDNEDRQTKR
jgi:hypothetical protein